MKKTNEHDKTTFQIYDEYFQNKLNKFQFWRPVSVCDEREDDKWREGYTKGYENARQLEIKQERERILKLIDECDNKFSDYGDIIETIIEYCKKGNSQSSSDDMERLQHRKTNKASDELLTLASKSEELVGSVLQESKSKRGSTEVNIAPSEDSPTKSEPDTLKCPKCGNKEKRELAPNYYQCGADDCYECFEDKEMKQ